MAQIPCIPAVSGGNRLGHVEEFRHDRLGLLRVVARECGDNGTLRNDHREIVVMNKRALVHQVLVEKARYFEKAIRSRTTLYPLAGEGLFTSEGDLWRRQRKLMAPIFQHGQVGA